MLRLTYEDGTPIDTCHNYREIYEYINHWELEKRRKSPSDPQQTPWSFQIFSPDKVAHLVNTLNNVYDEAPLFDAWHRQLPLVEMYEGDSQKIHQVIVEPNVRVEALREDWCDHYCHAHGMVITKTEPYIKRDDDDDD